MSRLCVLYGLLVPVTASGQPTGAKVHGTQLRAERPHAPPSATVDDGVRWRSEWQEIRWWEYAATASFLSTAFYLYVAGPAPPSNWHGGVLFDDAIVDAVTRPDDRVGDVAATTSTSLYFGAMSYRLLDSVFVPWLVHDDSEVALNIAMIDLASFSFVGITLWGSQVFVGRTRPRCETELGYGPCTNEHNGNDRRSFIAGHAATGFTAAGLTCTHHRHMPLYGGWGDDAACGIAVTAAAVNGVGRAVSGSHYPSDVVLGVVLGSFSGWALPALLHYGFDGRGAVLAKDGVRMMALPVANERQLGVHIMGAF